MDGPRSVDRCCHRVAAALAMLMSCLDARDRDRWCAHCHGGCGGVRESWGSRVVRTCRHHTASTTTTINNPTSRSACSRARLCCRFMIERSLFLCVPHERFNRRATTRSSLWQGAGRCEQQRATKRMNRSSTEKLSRVTRSSLPLSRSSLVGLAGDRANQEDRGTAQVDS